MVKLSAFAVFRRGAALVPPAYPVLRGLLNYPRAHWPVGARDVLLLIYVTTAFVPVGSARLVHGWCSIRPSNVSSSPEAVDGTRSDGAIAK
jgi:hypothetical protein